MPSPYRPYDRFRERDLTLNDYLAIDRTVLANERTLLSYVRTGLTLVIIGGSALKFFDSQVFTVVGWVFIACGAVVFFIGWRRYRHTDGLLRVALESQTGEKEHPLQEDLERKTEEERRETERRRDAEERV
jgi:putative membrane protein